MKNKQIGRMSGVIGIMLLTSVITIAKENAGQNMLMPADEAAIIDIVEHFSIGYSSTRMKAIQSELRRDRASQLCASLPNPVVTEWVGRVIDYTPGTDGLASFEFRLSPHLTVGSYADAKADVAASNDARLSETVLTREDGWRPTRGNEIIIFGLFDKNGSDCFEEKSLTQDNALNNPDFAFHVTALFPRYPN